MNVLLYVLDSLRPDHLSTYGYSRETSPTMTGLAEDGVVFENAFSQAIWTAPTSGSILTGLYPSVHGGETVSQPLSPDAPRLPRALEKEGLYTGAASTIDQVSEFRGYDDGFRDFSELFHDYAPDDPNLVGGLHEHLDRWIAERSDEDWFLLAWSLGTHTPYEFPEDISPAFADASHSGVDGSIESLKGADASEVDRIHDLYDSAIRHNDDHLANLVKTLKNEGVYDDTLIIVTADHGEVFDEHARLEQTPKVVEYLSRLPGLSGIREKFDLFEPSGFVGHSALLPYDELVRVPLIMKFPDDRFAGAVEDEFVQSIDIFPTVLDAVTSGDSCVDDVQGSSLLPLLEGEVEQVNPYVYSESRTLKGSNRYESIRTPDHKYVEINLSIPTLEDFRLQPHRALYSLLEYTVNDTRLLFEVEPKSSAADERTNRLSELEDEADDLSERLRDWKRENHSFDLTPASRTKLRANTKERLKQLGYMD